MPTRPYLVAALLLFILLLMCLLVAEIYRRTKRAPCDTRYAWLKIMAVLAMGASCLSISSTLGSDPKIYDLLAYTGIAASGLLLCLYIDNLRSGASSMRAIASYYMTLGVLAGLALFVSWLLPALSGGDRAIPVLLVLIGAVVFNPIRNFLGNVTGLPNPAAIDRSPEFAERIQAVLAPHSDLESILKASRNFISQYFKIERCSFALLSEYRMAIFGGQINLSDSDREALENITGKIVTQDVADGDLRRFMRSNSLTAVLKLGNQFADIGYLLLGRKKASLLTAKDKMYLAIATDEIAAAVRYAMRLAEVERFNLALQERMAKATSQLRKNNEKLIALDEAKDEFITMASHQLRTPLTSVKGYLSMLKEGDAGKLNAEQSQFVDQAFLSSQRMVFLIADLLNVSRIKTGKFLIESTPVYLPDVIKEEMDQLKGAVKAKKLAMSFDQPKHFPALLLDDTKIRQIIMNFLDNAVYYTPPRGTITVRLAATQKSVEFTVIDTGIGVPRASQHRLFTKFYRAENAQLLRPDGTGLGLFMAKKVIVAQGGAIIFKSKVGEGSTFGFSLPRAKLEIKQ